MSGESPGSGTETEPLPENAMMLALRSQGRMDETANPRGCKLEYREERAFRTLPIVCKRIAECRHCKSPQGSFPSLMGDRKFLQQQKGAYTPHSHKLALFCYSTHILCSANVFKSPLRFLKSFLCF